METTMIPITPEDAIHSLVTIRRDVSLLHKEELGITEAIRLIHALVAAREWVAVQKSQTEEEARLLSEIESILAGKGDLL
jgi:hypothetical protein